MRAKFSSSRVPGSEESDEAVDPESRALLGMPPRSARRRAELRDRNIGFAPRRAAWISPCAVVGRTREPIKRAALVLGPAVSAPHVNVPRSRKIGAREKRDGQGHHQKRHRDACILQELGVSIEPPDDARVAQAQGR